jgi:hypothetical protein
MASFSQLGPSHAHAPNPPGVFSVPVDPNQDARDLLREEGRRGAAQILAARGVTDLRAVVAVRRAFRPSFHSSQPDHDPRQSGSEEEERNLIVEETDIQDVGGDAGLTGDVTSVRMRRCFELVMKTGHVMRFEVRPSQTLLVPPGRADDRCGRPGLPKSP